MGDDFLYHRSGGLIIFVFFALLFLIGEGSYRVGRRNGSRSESSGLAQLGTIQGALLALLGLLFAFTFSMAVSRFDARKQSVVEESNAIGTASLRARLLPDPQSGESLRLFRLYVDNRVEETRVGFNPGKTKEFGRQAAQLQEQLWAQAVSASARDPHSVSTAIYIEALNQAIDAKSKRDGALNNHVPESVLILLLGAAIISLGVIGYTFGLEGSRSVLAMAALSTLIALVGWVILDLDRPYRGWIQIGQQPMIELQEGLKKAQP
jgi:hypothetical protein